MNHNVTPEIRYTGTKISRAQALGQKPLCIWLTGLSGSGKSTLAVMLDQTLRSYGRHVYVLDGDNIRNGLNKDLGFTTDDRKENIRRVAEVAKLMVDAGLIVIAAFISPFESERLMARNLHAEGDFLEVFVDAPLSICEVRDPKGLYKRARQGNLPEFTGIDSPYEPPSQPDVWIKTSEYSIEQCVEKILSAISK